MWRYMRRLLERVSAVFEDDTVLDSCLDVLVELLGADRGLVLTAGEDGSAHVIHARGARGTLTNDEREEISRTLVREARESGQCVVWDVSNERSASESVMALRILTAIAAPIMGPGGVRAVLYVDFRDARKFVGEQHVEFLMSAVVLFGAVLHQHGLGQRTRERLREAEGGTVQRRHAPKLETLLAPSSLARVRDELASALHGEQPILVLGESGTGKTLLAEAIAEASGRRPIVRAMLGGSDDLNTITSELFGHEKGSFSGANQRRVGLVEFADQGTLILDELLNLPPHAQKLLLDFTQFGTYRPLGYQRAEPKRAKVRIIAATNGDLELAIREGRFREDLYYRLAAVTLELPPLRERRLDLPALAESTLAASDPGRAWTLSLELRRLLLSPALEWPGNVRQFERAISRARDRAVLHDPKWSVLEPSHIEPRELGRGVEGRPQPAVLAAATDPTGAWRTLLEERGKLEEREVAVIRSALAQHNNVIAHAAKALGIARTTLASRMDALGIARS